MMTLEEINAHYIATEGWDTDTLLALAMDFIRDHVREEMWARFLATRGYNCDAEGDCPIHDAPDPSEVAE